MRRFNLIAALLLIVFGVLVLLGKIDLKQRKDLFKVGEFRASVQRDAPLPAWLGGLCIGLGSGLAVYALGRRR